MLNNVFFCIIAVLLVTTLNDSERNQCFILIGIYLVLGI